MRKFKLSVKRYADKLEKEFGFADPDMVKRYAIAKVEHKRRAAAAQNGEDPLKGVNLFANDPDCKTCGKNK